jgi:hypothetical protein
MDVCDIDFSAADQLFIVATQVTALLSLANEL